MMNRTCCVLLVLAVFGGGWSANGQDIIGIKYPITRKIPGISADGIVVPEQTVTVTTKHGWVVATLEVAPGMLEWEIVLSEVRPDTMPTIEVHREMPFFSIDYGPYFIRETLGRLRVFRERKDQQDDGWAVLNSQTQAEKLCNARGLFVVADVDWCWICCSPNNDITTLDMRVRFQHKELKRGHGALSMSDDRFNEVFCGEARCHDEGDLLVAQRMPCYAAEALLAAKRIEASLAGSDSPPITGRTIGSDERRMEMDSVKGKVVLVDFWATWCGPCVEKLPDVEALYQKYRDQGFVVIGVHSSQNADSVETFLVDNPVSFPVVVDDGQTEKRFAVSALPTYFLIGRDGKVVLAFEKDPPSSERIEAELARQLAEQPDAQSRQDSSPAK